MFPKLNIKEGALFIADAHDSAERAFFFDFLVYVNQNPPSQLFLMGDMFDLLVGSVSYGVKQYQRYIDLIEEIGKKNVKSIILKAITTLISHHSFRMSLSFLLRNNLI